MRKKDTWASQYRKRKFYQNQLEKSQKLMMLEKEAESFVSQLKEFTDLYDEQPQNNTQPEPILSKVDGINASANKQRVSDKLHNLATVPQKTIAVLLDLDGTSDFIDDTKAAIFIRQLDFLREKFGAEKGAISISTHHYNPSRMYGVLDTLARNLSENIKIGINFYFGGIYDYEQKLDIPQEYNFNFNKVSTFDKYYINSFNSINQWFAVIDDGISEDVYKKYQYNHPMLLCRPSQYENNLTDNNFMSIATTTEGFDGVIESLDTYISSIKDLSPEQVLETQRNMITHISSPELSKKVRDKDYAFIERYFSEGYADEADYSTALFWIVLTTVEENPTKEELTHLKNILESLINKFKERQEEINIEKIKRLYRNWGISE